ncbi:MAG: hypothetical protein CVV42_06520 [Candidatus Riflebacteria bacterium HGW-Riflebacteria-2]|jgi:Tfp pilus assembly protein PilF|nr:MAG: hypothetical protein CVV42_06520 [Candidatus Riflebacteria bacterium HGW-Riflebacteria-2]
MGVIHVCALAKGVAAILKENSPGIFETRNSLILALLALVILTFAPVMSADYLFFDEHIYILRNPVIAAPLSFDSLARIFTSFEKNIYTPLSIASFWLEYNMTGFNSAVSHFINLLLHLGCALMVFLVVEALLKNRKIAFVAAAIWAIHPAQVESVAWVLERRNLLYGLFYFASMAAYLRYLQRFRAVDMAVATVCMILSGLSKNLALFLPLVWLMLDWSQSRAMTRTVIVEKLPAVVVAIVYLSLMLFGVQDGISGQGQQTFNWLIATYTIGFYVMKTIFPIGIAPIYEINAGSEPWFLFGPVFLLITLGVAWSLCRKNRLVTFAWLFYLLNIVPLSGIVVVGYPFYAALHFIYVALFGIILGLAVLFYNLLSSCAKVHVFMPVSIVLTVALSVVSFQYSHVYTNSRTLFEYALEIDPDNRFARGQLATFLASQNDYAEAGKHYQELIKRYPDYFSGYYGMGRVYRRAGQYDVALTYFSRALELNSRRADLPFDRGLLLLTAGDFAAAEKDFSLSLQNKYSNMSLVYFWRSDARRRQGNYLGAIEDLLLAAADNKDDFSIKVGLVELYVESGQVAEAVSALMAVCRQFAADPSQQQEYMQIISSPSLAAVLTRSALYRNYFRYHFKWYPL